MPKKAERPEVREARRIRNSFAKAPRFFEFEKVVGCGRAGVACSIVLKTGPDENDWRRFVVKRALGQRHQAALRSEINILNKLAGALHIVQPFFIDPAIINPIDLLEGPTLFMEYLPNGTLEGFMDRIRNWEHPVPNRFLYRVFLCLLRACVAMAWPMEAPVGGPIRLEEVPQAPFLQNLKAQYTHNDMHGKNILIGDMDQEEHKLLPSFLLIDFGSALDRPPSYPNEGVRNNIRDVGLAMYTLIQKGEFPLNRRTGEISLQLPSGKRRVRTEGLALASPSAFPGLDPDLAVLLMWCLATEPRDAPGLEELVAAVEWCVRSKKADAYAKSAAAYYETDRGLKDILDALVFNAALG
ncbi:hypothetical protein F4809DRAFT_660877 [Biscogniauxia mediterranea]|nr:hypothetical protein F4809DRAFT_660877 [Biscogniauxia mediterranea]